VLTRILAAGDSQALDEAEALLCKGDLVAFPTDTVYGLGADLNNPQAIEQLYAVKGRESTKAIAVLLGNQDQLRIVTPKMGSMAQRLAEKFWPGPLTLVVTRHSYLPANLSLNPTVGVRMPDHPVALALLNHAGPLAVTSANLSEHPNSHTALEVLRQLDGRIPLILDGGRTPGGQPSTVVDCTGKQPAILRVGPISLDQLLTSLA
jgi:L-threonylcarbamoyladenylate synthase